MAQFKEKGVSDEVSEVLDLRNDPEKVVEGEYRGSRSFDGKRAGEVNTMHIFKGKDGRLVGVWGSNDLNNKLNGETGKIVRVRFKEKRNIGEGRTFKVYTVEVAQ